MPRKSQKHSSALSSHSPHASGSGSASLSSSSSASSSLPTPPAPAPIPEYDPKPELVQDPPFLRLPGLLWASPPAYPSTWEQPGKFWDHTIPLNGQHALLETPPASSEPLDGRCSPVSLGEVSRPPSPAASAASFSSRDSSDSGVVADARSKASHVTSISIPPSVASPAPHSQPPPTSFGHSWFFHAPVPSKPLSLKNFSPKTTRHSQFYFTDDLVTLNVDGCLFRVHRCFLERESTYFRKLFAREEGRGLSDETAIELPQVTVEAFEILLRFVYSGIHQPASCTVEDWISLLSAATSLYFPKLREHALCELEAPTSSLDPLDRLLLADRFEIARWRTPAYVALCMREHPLQESEAALLGVKVASQVAQARERVLVDMLIQCQSAPRTNKAGNWVRPQPTKDLSRVEQIVEGVFWPNGVSATCR